jgi:hypothetical protein
VSVKHSRQTLPKFKDISNSLYFTVSFTKPHAWISQCQRVTIPQHTLIVNPCLQTGRPATSANTTGVTVIPSCLQISGKDSREAQMLPTKHRRLVSFFFWFVVTNIYYCKISVTVITMCHKCYDIHVSITMLAQLCHLHKQVSHMVGV